MAVAAGLKALILRLSGQTDLVVGTATAARDRADLEGVVGFLTNTLSLRTDLSGDPSFAEALERERACALGAYAHTSLEFDRLVEELNPERSLARHPVFQVMLTLQPAAPDTVAFGPLTGRIAPADVTATPFDLMLHVLDAPSGIAATVEFATDPFDRASVEGFMGCLIRLLDAATAAPEVPLSRLPLVDAPERARLLSDYGRYDPAAPGPLVPEQVAARAAAEPEAVAVRFGQDVVRDRALERTARRLARRLRAAGIGRDRIVAVALERSAALPAALYAVHRAGGAYLPIDPAYPEERLRFMLEDSGAAVPLTEAGLAERFADPSRPTILIDAEDIDAEDADRADPAEDDAAGPGPAPEDLAYVIYTSGSTGRPKGVMIEHRALSNFLAAMRARIGLGAGDVLAAVTPLSFDIAGLEIWLPLAAGATVAIASRETATSGEVLRGFLAESRARVLQATPSSWRMLVEAGWTAGPGLTALCGGEALPPDLATALAANGAEAWNLYGPTETTIWSTCLRLGAGAGPASIGRPIDQTRVYVLGERLELLPVGAPGELCIAGAGLARGYLGRPDLTAERFPDDPYGAPGERLYRTGDLARLRADGSVDCLGRIDDQVKIRGHRIELGEIEAVLRGEPGIVEAAVVARAVSAGDLRLSAYLTVDEEGLAGEAGAVSAGDLRLSAYLTVDEEGLAGGAGAVSAGDLRLSAYLTVDEEGLAGEAGAVSAGDLRLSAYVTVDEEGLAGGAGAVGDWQEVWDDTYAQDDTEAEPSFAGWTSSLTGRPIPESEMETWLDETVDRIRSLAPRRLLEIGCGVGLIARRLAPTVESYHGTDLSGSAVRRLARWAEGRPEEAGHLRATRADALSAFDAAAADGAVDTVVINSVAQYFPDAAYLRRVLAGLADRLPAGGRVFVGDLRPAALLPTFHAAARLAQAAPEAGAGTLRAQTAQALRTEKELAVDPGFFHALQAEHPRVSAVQVALKRTGGDNELTRYRYDVTLEIGTSPRVPDGIAEGPADPAPGIGAARLDGERPGALLLRGLPNRRLARDLRAAAAIADGPEDAPASALRALADEAAAGTDPSEWIALGERLGYRVAAAFTPGSADGRFDVAFVDPGRGDPAAVPLGRPERLGAPADYAGRPDAARLRQHLSARLRTRLAAALPAYMVPGDIVPVERMPLTPSGKIDRKALPAPEAAPDAAPVASPPAGPTETALAALWCELLAVARIDRHGDFFHLGGHSLLAMRLVARLRSTLQVDLPMRTIFEHPTLAAFAREIERAGPRLRARDAPPGRLRAAVPDARDRRRARRLRRPRRGAGGRPDRGRAARPAGRRRRHGRGDGRGRLRRDRAVPSPGRDPPRRLVVRRDGRVRDGAPPRGARTPHRDPRPHRSLPAPPGPSGRAARGAGAVEGVPARPDRNRRGAVRAGAAPDPIGSGRPPGSRIDPPSSDEPVSTSSESALGERVGDFAGLARVLAPPGDRGSRVEELTALHRIFCRNFRAWARYRPHPAPLPALVLSASEQAPDEAAAGRLRIDWRTLALGGASGIAVPGDHFSMLRAPRAQALARHLQARHDRWQSAG